MHLEPGIHILPFRSWGGGTIAVAIDETRTKSAQCIMWGADPFDTDAGLLMWGLLSAGVASRDALRIPKAHAPRFRSGSVMAGAFAPRNVARQAPRTRGVHFAPPDAIPGVEPLPRAGSHFGLVVVGQDGATLAHLTVPDVFNSRIKATVLGWFLLWKRDHQPGDDERMLRIEEATGYQLVTR